MKRSAYIEVEGADGCGKSTQADLVVRRLQAGGCPAVLSAQPTQEGLIGGVIRSVLAREHDVRDPRTLPLLFAADRMEHGAWLREHLDDGRVVIGDRGALSTWAYALATARAAGDPHAEAVGRWADVLSDFALLPSLIVLLDLPFEACRARLDARGDRSALEGEDVQRHVHAIYREEAESSRLGGLVVRVDASGSKNAVGARISALVEQHLQRHRSR